MKSTNHRKALVRNTEQAVPKSVVITEPKSKAGVKTLKPAKKNEVEDEKLNLKKFDSPELNSTLQLARKIKTVENLKPRKTKSASDIGKKEQLAFGEKVSKRVNFPYCQPIYKDLIPLCVKMQSQPMINTREPLPLKDREPLLCDFLTPRTLPEYSFQVPSVTLNRTLARQYNGLKLFKTTQKWTE